MKKIPRQAHKLTALVAALLAVRMHVRWVFGALANSRPVRAVLVLVHAAESSGGASSGGGGNDCGGVYFRNKEGWENQLYMCFLIFIIRKSLKRRFCCSSLCSIHSSSCFFFNSCPVWLILRNCRLYPHRRL